MLRLQKTFYSNLCLKLPKFISRPGAVHLLRQNRRKTDIFEHLFPRRISPFEACAHAEAAKADFNKKLQL
jgi:hypothetical protein